MQNKSIDVKKIFTGYKPLNCGYAFIFEKGQHKGVTKQKKR